MPEKTEVQDPGLPRPHPIDRRAAKPAAAKSMLDVMLMKPTTAKTGDNVFEVVVKDAPGKPTTNATRHVPDGREPRDEDPGDE